MAIYKYRHNRRLNLMSPLSEAQVDRSASVYYCIFAAVLGEVGMPAGNEHVRVPVIGIRTDRVCPAGCARFSPHFWPRPFPCVCSPRESPHPESCDIAPIINRRRPPIPIVKYISITDAGCKNDKLSEEGPISSLQHRRSARKTVANGKLSWRTLGRFSSEHRLNMFERGGILLD